MNSIKFDLATPYIHTAVDMTDYSLQNLGQKLANKCSEFYKTDATPGIVAQWMSTNLSPNEMLFLASKEVLSSIVSAAKKSEKHCEKSCKKNHDLPTKKELKRGKKLLKELQSIESAKDFSKFLTKIAEEGGMAFKDGRIQLGSNAKMTERNISPFDMEGGAVPRGLEEFLTKLRDGLKRSQEERENTKISTENGGELNKAPEPEEELAQVDPTAGKTPSEEQGL